MAGYYSYYTPDSHQLKISQVNQHVDSLVRELEGNFPRSSGLVISEIIKGGSLGHGTAVPNKFDLDLVVYLRDLHIQSVLFNGVQDILHKFDQHLRKTYGGNYVCNNFTPFALQFTLYGELDVDLLPSPFWHSHEAFVKDLTPLSKQERRKLQCGEAKWEKHFFQRQPNEVKEYIKRAKAWRNKKWPEHQSKGGRPKSFLLGLLVIAAWDKCGYSKDARSVTRELQQMVKNHHSLRLYWTNNGAYYDDRLFLQHNLLSPPYIIDPANPFNNVYESGISYHWASSKETSYSEGDGNWTEFVWQIDTLDLSVSI